MKKLNSGTLAIFENSAEKLEKQITIIYRMIHLYHSSIPAIPEHQAASAYKILEGKADWPGTWTRDVSRTSHSVTQWCHCFPYPSRFKAVHHFP